MSTHASLSINDKIKQAVQVITPIPMFNKDSSIEEKEKLAEKWLWEILSELGLYKDSDDIEDLLMSDECTEGDARRYFCENKNNTTIPVVRFKKIWSILKSGKTEEVKEVPVQSNLNGLINAMRPIGQYSDDELLDLYNSECPESIVEELNKRSHGRAFIIFNDKNCTELNIPMTRKILKIARHKDTPDFLEIDGVMYYPKKAGEFKVAVYEECPIHKGVLLTEGYCDECCVSWSKTDMKIRQFVRLMHENNETPTSRREVKMLTKDDLEDLKLDYPDIWRQFEEMDEENELPSLKSRSANVSSKKMDPFGNKRY